MGRAGFGRAKSCILIFMWGGPSQLDTWDLKPDAPDQIRGPFNPIATSVPGLSISEHFPMLASRDRIGWRSSARCRTTTRRTSPAPTAS